MRSGAIDSKENNIFCITSRRVPFLAIVLIFFSLVLIQSNVFHFVNFSKGPSEEHVFHAGQMFNSSLQTSRFPENYSLQVNRAEFGKAMTEGNERRELKRILYWTGWFSLEWPLKPGRLQCDGYTCDLTTDKTLVTQSHALIFHGWGSDMPTMRTFEDNEWKYRPVGTPLNRTQDQHWVFFQLEPPLNLPPHLDAFDNLFNWTMTYRTNSDVFVPYGRFLRKLVQGQRLLPNTKAKLVAQIASNCDAPSKRHELIRALQRHIPVDVYGKCGPLKCSAGNCKSRIGKQYKFYLAFENSLCQDYITEKVFDAYAAGMVPVVYGGANYDTFLPSRSYIDVNSFASAGALADYLLYLDSHEDEYLRYFDWTEKYYVDNNINYTEAFCNLCTKLHEEDGHEKQRVVPNLSDWVFYNGGKYPVCREPLNW